MCSSCRSINKLHKPHIINASVNSPQELAKDWERKKKTSLRKQIFAKENNHRFIDSELDGILKNTFQYLLRHRHPKTVPSKNAESVCTVEPSSEKKTKNLYFGLGPKCLLVAFKHRFSSCTPDGRVNFLSYPSDIGRDIVNQPHTHPA